MLASFGGETSCQSGLTVDGAIAPVGGIELATSGAIHAINADPYTVGWPSAPDVAPTQLAVKNTTDGADDNALYTANWYTDSLALHDFPLPAEFTGLDATNGITVHGTPGQTRVTGLTYSGGAYDLSTNVTSATLRPLTLLGFTAQADVYTSNVAMDFIPSLMRFYNIIPIQLYNVPTVAGPTVERVNSCIARRFPAGVKRTVFGAASYPMDSASTTSSHRLLFSTSGASTTAMSVTLKFRATLQGGTIGTITGRTVSLGITSPGGPVMWATLDSFSPGTAVKNTILVSLARNVDANPDDLFVWSLRSQYFLKSWGAASTAI